MHIRHTALQTRHCHVCYIDFCHQKLSFYIFFFTQITSCTLYCGEMSARYEGKKNTTPAFQQICSWSRSKSECLLPQQNKQQKNHLSLSLYSCRVTLQPVKMRLQPSEIMTGSFSACVNTLIMLCCMGKGLILIAYQEEEKCKLHLLNSFVFIVNAKHSFINPIILIWLTNYLMSLHVNCHNSCSWGNFGNFQT